MLIQIADLARSSANRPNENVSVGKALQARSLPRRYVPIIDRVIERLAAPKRRSGKSTVEAAELGRVLAGQPPHDLGRYVRRLGQPEPLRYIRNALPISRRRDIDVIRHNGFLVLSHGIREPLQSLPDRGRSRGKLKPGKLVGLALGNTNQEGPLPLLRHAIFACVEQLRMQVVSESFEGDAQRIENSQTLRRPRGKELRNLLDQNGVGAQSLGESHQLEDESASGVAQPSSLADLTERLARRPTMEKAEASFRDAERLAHPFGIESPNVDLPYRLPPRIGLQSGHAVSVELDGAERLEARGVDSQIEATRAREETDGCFSSHRTLLQRRGAVPGPRVPGSLPTDLSVGVRSFPGQGEAGFPGQGEAGSRNDRSAQPAHLSRRAPGPWSSGTAHAPASPHRVRRRPRRLSGKRRPWAHRPVPSREHGRRTAASPGAGAAHCIVRAVMKNGRESRQG